MTRWLAALLSLAAVLLAAPASATSGNLTLFGVAIAVVLTAALVLRAHGRQGTPSPAMATPGPVADERCLHGLFRRQSSPDTPGRPQQPRAPGNGSRLAP